MIGHGSDGCTYSLFVEDADKDTKITAINSELVNTRIRTPVRSYVLMGEEVNTPKVHPDAELILYNSAFWGSPTLAAIINSGTVRFQQGNFQRSGATGIENRGGKAHVYTSYFAQPIPPDGSDEFVYVKLQETGVSTELTNNYYDSGLQMDNAKEGMVYGTDVEFKK